MYVKIFEDILDSSVWDESLATRIVWLTMLIMCDEEGVVRAATSGIRRRAGVSDQELKGALKTLTGPDLDSKDKSYGGRRVEQIDGGFVVLNYKKYREIRTKKQLADAERQRRHRAKPKDEVRDMSQVSQPVTTNAYNSKANAISNGETVNNEDSSPQLESEVVKEEKPVGEDRPSTSLVVPTNKKPILACDIAKSLAEFMQHDLNKHELLAAQCTALFSYYCHKTRKRAGSTQFTVDRFNRLKRFIQQRGLSFCLYVCDGGVKHPHLNQDSGKNWELDSFFPYNNADRLEKLVGITKFDDEPTHPWLAKHPDLEG